MAEKQINGRTIQKHDSEANWEKATNFIPKAGEIIIYDTDETHYYCRIKIGDGSTLINNLPFSTEEEIESYAAPLSHTHNYAGSSSAGGAATSAKKLATARAITLSGAVNGSANFDGSGDTNISTTFPENITIPGTITANKVIGAVYM